MKKIYIKTFGCQMNEYDSDKMADVLNVAEGLTPTSTPEDADVILFNTCSVREKAQEKVFHDLGRVRHLKQANPNLIIGVGGCVASQEGAAIVERVPYVDVRRAADDRRAFLARHATADADDDVAAAGLQRLPPAQLAEDLLLRLLAHRAGIEQDDVRILGGVGGDEALVGSEHVGHLGRVVLVHLAAEGADE